MQSIQMNEVTCEEIQILGLSVRTNNADEMNVETARIGILHGTFNQQLVVNYENGAHLFGVYYGYESDHTGDFTVLVGSEESALTMTRAENKASLDTVTLCAGKYLVFSGTGEMPQVVIDVWGDIWRYFSGESSQGKPKYQRAFTTDFERYTSANSVDVYIAIL